MPVVVGFVIAAFTTPAGVSGAFLLLPFQFSVLGFTAPGVTPTNLLYNVFSTPGGILRYRSQGDVDWSLVKAIVLGAAPGIIVGSLLRISVFEDPDSFKVFVGVVLLGLGANVAIQTVMKKRTERATANVRRERSPWISVIAAGAGTLGGIYGISGGSIIAPVLVGIFGFPVSRAAPAALVATLFTSIAGVASFEILNVLAATGAEARNPDWLLALLFGIGGAAGGNVGARLNKRAPEGPLRLLLSVISIVVGVTYIRPLV